MRIIHLSLIFTQHGVFLCFSSVFRDCQMVISISISIYYYTVYYLYCKYIRRLDGFTIFIQSWAEVNSINWARIMFQITWPGPLQFFFRPPPAGCRYYFYTYFKCLCSAVIWILKHMSDFQTMINWAESQKFSDSAFFRFAQDELLPRILQPPNLKVRCQGGSDMCNGWVQQVGWTSFKETTGQPCQKRFQHLQIVHSIVSASTISCFFWAMFRLFELQAAALRLFPNLDGEITFSVPTGNFGDILAGCADVRRGQLYHQSSWDCVIFDWCSRSKYIGMILYNIVYWFPVSCFDMLNDPLQFQDLCLGLVLKNWKFFEAISQPDHRDLQISVLAQKIECATVVAIYKSYSKLQIKLGFLNYMNNHNLILDIKLIPTWVLGDRQTKREKGTTLGEWACPSKTWLWPGALGKTWCFAALPWTTQRTPNIHDQLKSS